MALTENTLADSFSIRESLFATREKARNILRAQQDRTAHTLRKRIFETQRARNELEYQLGKVCVVSSGPAPAAFSSNTNAIPSAPPYFHR